jgi:hypothetical protein
MSSAAAGSIELSGLLGSGSWVSMPGSTILEGDSLLSQPVFEEQMHHFSVCYVCPFVAMIIPRHRY